MDFEMTVYIFYSCFLCLCKNLRGRETGKQKREKEKEGRGRKGVKR